MSPASPFVSWEAMGRNAAPLLEHVNAVVIAGPDPVAAASFALGIARVHGSTRRVAIADLVGEVAPLQALVVGENPHGISDSFLYGVSLNKVAQPLEGSGNVFLMPSGTEPVATELVYGNERWRKLAAGFHQVGALLLVVAVPGTPRFADLCGYIGAIFPIGDPAPAVPPGVRALSLPRPAPPEVVRVVEKARAVGSEDRASRNRKYIAALLATIGVALLVGLSWSRIVDRLPDSVVRLLPGRPWSDTIAVADSTKAAGTTTDAAGTGGLAPAAALVVDNPADSAHAAAYAVYLVASNTREGAVLEPRVQALPAVAITPVILDSNGTRLFRVTVGAAEQVSAAEALLARLRTAGMLGPASGSIIRVPYALRLQQGLAAEAVPAALAGYEKRGISAYALRQANGGVSIFTGAHESVEQAAFLADSLRLQGVDAVLVFRTGRAL